MSFKGIDGDVPEMTAATMNLLTPNRQAVFALNVEPGSVCSQPINVPVEKCPLPQSRDHYA